MSAVPHESSAPDRTDSSSEIRQRDSALGLRRGAAALVFWGVGRYLPWSPRPGGKIARRFRGYLAGYMLDSCGEKVNVERGAQFGSGRGIRLGDRSDIGLDSLIIGPITIGDDVMIGPRCVFLSDRHRLAGRDRPMNQQGFLEPRRIVIEDDVFIGAGSTVLPGVRVGHGSVVGAGSVVAKDVPPNTVVAGNPAVVVKQR